MGGVYRVPDLQVHDDLPLVHVLCVNFHPVDSQRLHTHTHTQSRVIPEVRG